MRRAAILRHDRGVRADTARVTRPRTGFAYLDGGLDQPGAVLAFAHRGGAFHPEIEGLENTLAAFSHAVSLGYRYLETDVHATRDGVLLAFHDDVLDRVTASVGRLADLSYGEVRAARIGEREEIPTLASLMESFPDARFNIDIKAEAAVAPLAELVRTTGSHDRVCVGAFSDRRMSRFRRLLDRPVATACGPGAVVGVRFAPTHGWAARLAGAGAVLQVPHRRGRLRVVTEELVARAHALGRPVHVWTVDEPAEMHHLLDLGVDGLMTDRTDVLRDVLVARGQWMGEAP
jgi:glycerophosphoryl diester phosphodiesterase